MKAIIYAGIGLFAAASVYGLVDYSNSTKKNDSINKLYVADETPVIPKPEETGTVAPAEIKEVNVPAETNVVEQKSVAQKNKKRSKKIRLEDFSRARIPERQIEEMKKSLPGEKAIEDAGEVKPVKEIPVLKQKG